MAFYIYFKTNDWSIIRKIQQRFRLPGVTVNGETCLPCDVSPDDMELLRETERRGYIQIRQKQ